MCVLENAKEEPKGDLCNSFPMSMINYGFSFNLSSPLRLHSCLCLSSVSGKHLFTQEI